MKAKKAIAYGLHATIYMVRHATQLPVTAGDIARSEGIPHRYLAKILGRLAGAGILEVVNTPRRGYIFAVRPERITLLKLFQAIDHDPLFQECFLQHCDCGALQGACEIYEVWRRKMDEMTEYLAHTSIDAVAWGHPEHRFDAGGAT